MKHAAERVLEEAADWLVKSDENALDEDSERELTAWRRQSPDNERAWQAACRLRSMLGAVPSEMGASTLGRRRMDRRTLLKSLAALAVLPATGWLGYAKLPWEIWQADMRTAKGEQRIVTLPDSGELVVNTDTAVDVAYSENARALKLHRGEIRVTTAPDPAASPRPFTVTTEQGRIRAMGTQFIVRTNAPGYPGTRPHTEVTVTRHAVAIAPNEEREETVVRADFRAAFSEQRVHPPESASNQSQAWVKGQLIADNQRLDQFLMELARYRPGVLRVDPAVANLRISGVFQLNNTDQVLEILANTLPVRVSRVTGYWVTVVPV
ncbi:FecR domain-containing protein [Marinobacter sp. ATCH36]|uniref:FecR domain-containing protein n=1 Tax=Marinobacter sp. ATCH36 TaxID=2945106 RepID=UPI002021F5A2|nr:FecR domain-containing protein [Marinobacter sp. ATCH36]MCL7942449.1 FecR domain-containing protein [Marinobacter sp. ATCH36]